MTQIRPTIIRKVKDISLGGSLAIVLLSTMQACNSQGGSGGSYDMEETESYKYGVQSYIKEVSKGEFKIVDEKKVPLDSALAIVTYMNGKQDTLKPELAKALIDKEVNQNSYSYHHNSLGNALLYGGMGYMLARMMGGNANAYSNYRQQYENDQNNKRGGSYGFYSSPATYQKSQSIHQEVGSSRIVLTRPVGSKSGFFHGSSRILHMG